MNSTTVVSERKRTTPLWVWFSFLWAWGLIVAGMIDLFFVGLIRPTNVSMLLVASGALLNSSLLNLRHQYQNRL